MGKVRNKQQGAAAIFIVVFFAILISVIALSFLNIAVQDQEQSTNDDLSQSAYDSANAGTEDAKRALSWYELHCPANSAPAPADASNCATYATTFTSASNQCNLASLTTTGTLPGVQLAPGSTSEVLVETNSNVSSDDTKLNQAYTCTTIATQTSDYKAVATNGKSDNLIPLQTVGQAAAPTDAIELNWFTDVNAGTDTPTFSSPKDLPLPSQWLATAPPIMRVELVPVLRGNIDINNVDNDTRTVFLYPTTGAASNVALSAEDLGRSAEKPDAPNLAHCQSTLPAGTYDCSATINTLPPATGDTSGNHAGTDYYLRITSLYNNADYQIRLFDSSGNPLLFNNVEPQIDSTGRADDVFRRIQSRITDLTSSNPLTDGGFDITQGLCKDFNVPVYTDNCNPTSLVNP
jgi:Tfp pilus assembly protein PilX